MHEGGGKKSSEKGVFFAIDSFSLPVLVPVMAEIALSVIVWVNKPFTALFLFKLFTRQTYRRFPFGSGMMLGGPARSNI